MAIYALRATRAGENLVTGKKTNEWQEKAIGRRISNESAEA